MDVVLNRQRERVVDHSSHIGDIQTARSYIRRHKEPRLARLEILQRLHPPRLRHVTMQPADTEALAAKHAFDALRFLFVQREYEDPRLFGAGFLLRNQPVKMS